MPSLEAMMLDRVERKMSNYKLGAGGPLHPSQVRALRRNVKRNCLPEIYALLDQAITAQQPGLTKLEDFTKAALQGLLANPDLTHIPPVDAGHKATIYAEAALAELEKRNG